MAWVSDRAASAGTGQRCYGGLVRTVPQAASGLEAGGRAPQARVDRATRRGRAATARGAQPRQLIVTVYGLYARAEGGWMSVASLVSLLADLGVDEPAVRSSISRLKRREVLRAGRPARLAGACLPTTPPAAPQDAHPRTSPPRPPMAS